ncbi:excinuclease ABC, C subunit [Denitrovibrio acetiphilus DSM 12809]|uniref:UvrABC system protein C n=1 Tax=Denitrovibrio acetiphilus (strain DSM 12809 / NBRC 114555 / N2460) TaxID=522772 RepID=D4H3J2_DENA2|nr:excinuclease ABC subunit UvrC [Denitrovibrio acetiphilus]ADD69094.1 excinuclease ABC, C subunit [Denitrovibrio acetiphilus DSM 12809]
MFKPVLKEIPENPGIYLYLGKNGEILYVGKAKNLRNRVSSYFVDFESKPIRTRKMLQSARDIRFVVTTSEAEALLLENNVIKTEKPRYNVRLKDSKSYPFILITEEDYPKLRITRESGKKGEYFGPFVDVGSLRSIVDELLKVFPLRSCGDSKFREGKLCLKFQIRKCLGPCENMISKNRYNQLVEQIREFFRGNVDTVKSHMEQEMMRLSDDMNFEEAAIMRDRLRGLSRLFTKQTVVMPDDTSSIDVFVPHSFENVSGITAMFIRGGRLIGSRTEILEDDENPSGVIESFVLQMYSVLRNYPQMVYIAGLEDSGSLQEALEKLADKKLRFRKRGYAAVEKLALDNGRVQTQLYLNKLSKRKDITEKLKKIIGAESVSRIECVDISHLGGSGTVGVSIVAVDGEFSKAQYRKYRIRTAENDDFISIYELFSRKFENIQEGSEPPADLYIVDGGIGQLNSAMRAASEKGYTANFISISKGRSIKFMKDKQEQSIESVHIPGRKNPLNLKKNDPLLLFIQKVRDESHRFAIDYSRKLALKNFKKSPLLMLEGVGEKTVRKVLEVFPDIYERKDLTAKDISEYCSIPEKTAAVIELFIKSQ